MLTRAPEGWLDPERPGWRIGFGQFEKRGWIQSVGTGRMFDGTEFKANAEFVKLQESCRPVVAFLHGIEEDALCRVDERVSVKPARTPELRAHIDVNRRGSYQVVIALSEAPFLVFPYSHKATKLFLNVVKDFHPLTRDQLERLRDEYESVATYVPAKPGDVLVFEGGSFVHGSVEIKMGEPTRYAAYAQFWPTGASLVNQNLLCG